MMKLRTGFLLIAVAITAPQVAVAQSSVGAGHSFGAQSSGHYGSYWRQSSDVVLTPASVVCLERKSDRRVFCKSMREWKAVAASVDAGAPDPKLIR